MSRKARKSKSKTTRLTGIPPHLEETQEFMTVLATPSGRRQCLIVVGQTRDDETQILFKVLEYKTEAAIKFSSGNLIGTPAAVNYVPIHSSRIGKMTEKLQAQVTNGVPLVTECIRRAVAELGKIYPNPWSDYLFFWLVNNPIDFSSSINGYLRRFFMEWHAACLVGKLVLTNN